MNLFASIKTNGEHDGVSIVKEREVGFKSRRA